MKHDYLGRCPDPLQPLARDAKCPACRATVFGWAVVTPEGVPVGGDDFTFATTRKASIRRFMSDSTANSWAECYRRGYRCVRYVLQPVVAGGQS